MSILHITEMFRHALQMPVGTYYFHIIQNMAVQKVNVQNDIDTEQESVSKLSDVITALHLTVTRVNITSRCPSEANHIDANPWSWRWGAGACTHLSHSIIRNNFSPWSMSFSLLGEACSALNCGLLVESKQSIPSDRPRAYSAASPGMLLLPDTDSSNCFHVHLQPNASAKIPINFVTHMHNIRLKALKACSKYLSTLRDFALPQCYQDCSIPKCADG
jgi:hypothetical protein